MDSQYDVLDKQNNQQFAEEDLPLAEFEVVEDIPFAVVEQEKRVLLVIEDVFSIIGRGAVIVGKIENGTVSVGESVIINEKNYVVSALENCKKMINVASCGMEVGMLLKNAGKKDLKRGDLVYKKL